MELTVQKSDLLPELSLLQGVVDRKSTIPILSHFLFEAADNRLSLTATDLDLTIRTAAAAVVAKAGAATVPAKKMFELVRNLPEGPVTIKLQENDHLKIESGRSSFKMVALGAKDYPTPPSVDDGREVSLPFGLFRRAISKVLFAVSLEEGRFAIGGSLVKIKNGGCEMISTDGHRMAFVSFPLPEPQASAPEPVLVPRKALAELQRFPGGDDERIVLSTSTNHLGFRVAGRSLFSRTLDVRFPDYEKVLSKDNDRRIPVPVSVLLSALRRVSLFSSDRSQGVKFEVKDSEMIVSSANPEFGEAREEMSVPYQGDGFHIGLNAKYLLDFLAEVESDDVLLNFKDENTHCMGTPQGEIPGFSRYAYIVMPMRI